MGKRIFTFIWINVAHIQADTLIYGGCLKDLRRAEGVYFRWDFSVQDVGGFCFGEVTYIIGRLR